MTHLVLSWQYKFTVTSCHANVSL